MSKSTKNWHQTYMCGCFTASGLGHNQLCNQLQMLDEQEHKQRSCCSRRVPKKHCETRPKSSSTVSTDPAKEPMNQGAYEPRSLWTKEPMNHGAYEPRSLWTKEPMRRHFTQTMRWSCGCWWWHFKPATFKPTQAIIRLTSAEWLAQFSVISSD